MSRRKTNVNGATVGSLLFAGVIYLIATAVHAVGAAVILVAIIGVIVLVIWLQTAAKKKRIEYLTAKYNDATIVDNIYNRRYWQGQTVEQLVDSLGNPHGIDHKLLKTINRQVWKYNPRGVNRYGLRITVDDGIVRSWDHKR